jgi:hypothetical protein
MKSTTKLVLTAALFLGACTTSEPIDFAHELPVVLPADAATAGQAGATGQQGGVGSGGGAAGSGSSSADQGGSSGMIAASGGMAGGTAGDPSTVLPDAAATDARAEGDASTDSMATDAGVNATWTDIYNRLLNNPSYASNCTGAPCHDPGTQKGLDLSTQAKGYSTAKGKLVVGSPNTSKIVTQLNSGSMPQARPRMPATDLAVIKAWIMAGALNN